MIVDFENCTIETIKKMFDDFYESLEIPEIPVIFEGKFTPAQVQTALLSNFDDPEEAIDEMKQDLLKTEQKDNFFITTLKIPQL